MIFVAYTYNHHSFPSENNDNESLLTNDKNSWYNTLPYKSQNFIETDDAINSPVISFVMDILLLNTFLF